MKNLILSSCLLIFITIGNIGGCGGGNGNGGDGGSDEPVDEFSVILEGKLFNCLSQEVFIGSSSISRTNCASEDVPASVIDDIANNFVVELESLLLCADLMGWSDFQFMLFFQSIEAIVSTQDTIALLCGSPGATGCFRIPGIINSDVLIAASATEGVILPTLMHEVGHLIEFSILGCATHGFGSISEECGSCDNQYGEIDNCPVPLSIQPAFSCLGAFSTSREIDNLEMLLGR